MKRFKKVYIEITNVCNLACSFCPQTKRKGMFMPIDTFSKILDQIQPYTDYLYFHVKGEPLLHPQIGVFLDLCHERGFKVNITTNGTLINEAKAKIIKKPALRQVNFSLHSLGGNEDCHDKQAYIHHILDFVQEARAQSGVIITLRFWNLERDSEPKLYNEQNSEFLTILERAFDIDLQSLEGEDTTRGIKLADRVYLNHDHQFVWPDLKEEEDEGRGFCYGLRDQAAILVDGTVVPCCLDGEGVINLGNIHHTPFSEIIESQRARAIFNGFSQRNVVEELCRKCDYRKRFRS